MFYQRRTKKRKGLSESDTIEISNLPGHFYFGVRCLTRRQTVTPLRARAVAQIKNKESYIREKKLSHCADLLE